MYIYIYIYIYTHIIKILILTSLGVFAPLRLQVMSLSAMPVFLLTSLAITGQLNYLSLMNYDMITTSLLSLTFWVLLLIVFSQFQARMVKSLCALFLVLGLSLVLSFSTPRALMFYFFFEWSLLPIFIIVIG